MKHCPRAVSIARPSTLQLTALPSELAAAPRPPRDGHIYADFEKSVNESHCQQNEHLNCEFLSPKPLINETLFFCEHNIKAASYSALLIL